MNVGAGVRAAGSSSLALRWLGSRAAARSPGSRSSRASRWPPGRRRRAGPYELIRGRVHGEVDPADRRNAIIQDLALAPRNARGRVEYVATFALAAAGRSRQGVGRADLQRRQPRQRRADRRRPTATSGWSAAGRAICRPAADKQTIAVPVAPQRRRLADHRPDDRALRQRRARHDDAADPPRDDRQPAAGVSAGRSRPARRAADQRRQRDRRRRPARRPRGAARATGRSPTAGRRRFPARRTRRSCASRAASIRRGSTSSPTPSAIRWCSASAWRRRATSPRSSAAPPADAHGTPNPVAGAIRHVVAIGDSQSGNFIRSFIHLGFNEGADGRAVWDGAFPRIAARQTPINLRFGVPGGAASLFEAGSEPAIWWGALRGSGAPPAAGQPARSLHRVAHLSEDRRGVRLGGVLGPAHVAGSGRHRRPGRHPAAGQRAPLLLSGHDARRRPRRLRGRGRRRRRPAARCRPTPTRRPITTRALTRALVEWVVRRRGAAREPLSAPGARRAGGADSRSRRPFASIPGARDPAPLLNPVLEYDFGPGLDAERPDRRAARGAAARPARAAVARAARRAGRQRAGRRAVGAAPGAARHLPRLERLRRRLLQGSGLRLQRRLPAVRAHAGRAPGVARSAAVARGALPVARRLRRRGARRGRGRGRAARSCCARTPIA